MNTRFIITILLIIFCSCSTKKTDNSEIYRSSKIIAINPKDASVRVNYTSWFGNIDYIPLQTDSNFLVGKVDELLVTDDYYFIMDQSITHSVYCFDKNGHEVFKIKSFGQGPGEYTYMEDIFLDKKNNELVIHCLSRKKLLYFDMHGTYLREEPFPYIAVNTRTIGNNFAIYCGYHDNADLKEMGKYSNLTLIGSDNTKILKEFYKTPFNRGVVWSSNCQFSQINDTLLSIKPDHCSIVYHITPTAIFPAYKIDYGKFNIDNMFWAKSREKEVDLKKFESFCLSMKYCQDYAYLEGNDYCYFRYRQDGKQYHVLYSKKTAKIQQTQFFQNDMDFISPFGPISIYNDKFYCLLEPESIFEIRDLITNKWLPDNILKNVKELDNPIIAVFTIKPF